MSETLKKSLIMKTQNHKKKKKKSYTTKHI